MLDCESVARSKDGQGVKWARASVIRMYLGEKRTFFQFTGW